MQTEVEVKAIKKRTEDLVVNSSKIYGVNGNEVKGYSSSEGDEYSAESAKKGGETEGSLVNHLNNGFDLSTGGDSEDKKNREKQQSYVIPGKVTYNKENYYSDVDDIKVDTSGNIGQVIIY